MKIDKFQGYTDGDRKFGYLCGDEGGWFFVWHDDLEATIDSLDVDYDCGDGGISFDEAEAALRDLWKEESEKPNSQVM